MSKKYETVEDVPFFDGYYDDRINRILRRYRFEVSDYRREPFGSLYLQAQLDSPSKEDLAAIKEYVELHSRNNRKMIHAEFDEFLEKHIYNEDAGSIKY